MDNYKRKEVLKYTITVFRVFLIYKTESNLDWMPGRAYCAWHVGGGWVEAEGGNVCRLDKHWIFFKNVLAYITCDFTAVEQKG